MTATKKAPPPTPSSSEEGVGGGGPTRKVLLDRASAMRKNPTEPERRMWMALRDKRFFGFKFRRQAVIGSRIMDLFCPTKALAIEIDGHTHDPDLDRVRDAILLRQFGIATLRFSNVDVMTNIDGVLLTLKNWLDRSADRWSGHRATTPRPPPLKRRGRSARNLEAPSSSEEGVGGGAAARHSVAEALRAAAARLAEVSDTARLDAEVLMAHALGVERSELLLRRMGEPVPSGFAALVERRRGNEPVAYIVGHQEFYGLDFAVTPAVLIPRGDSEVLIEAARAYFEAAARNPRRILDLGTGSGALLLTALTLWPEAEGTGIDCSSEAIEIAGENAIALDLAADWRMQLADWSEPGWADDFGLFDLILANPPYVEDDAALAPSVRDHEPAGALFAGPEGLEAYRVLIPQLPALLAPGGVALVEIGAGQAEAVSAIAAAAGFSVRLHHDLAGRPRAVALALELNNSLGISPASA